MAATNEAIVAVDGLISCEKSNVFMKDFVIGGERADSQSNGP
jgi:hypothetical protein